jgi:hypothetical protein
MPFQYALERHLKRKNHTDLARSFYIVAAIDDDPHPAALSPL